MRRAKHIERQRPAIFRRLHRPALYVSFGKTIGVEFEVTLAGEFQQRRVFGGLGIYAHRAPGHQEFTEQPHLGAAILGHRAVIVEMVARQVGKSGCREAHAVEPVLR